MFKADTLHRVRSASQNPAASVSLPAPPPCRGRAGAIQYGFHASPLGPCLGIRLGGPQVWGGGSAQLWKPPPRRAAEAPVVQNEQSLSLSGAGASLVSAAFLRLSCGSARGRQGASVSPGEASLCGPSRSASHFTSHSFGQTQITFITLKKQGSRKIMQ